MRRKKRYEDNDAEWRKRYRERFTTGQEIVNETKEDVKRDGTMQTYEDLFELCKDEYEGSSWEDDFGYRSKAHYNSSGNPLDLEFPDPEI